MADANSPGADLVVMQLSFGKAGDTVNPGLTSYSGSRAKWCVQLAPPRETTRCRVGYMKEQSGFEWRKVADLEDVKPGQPCAAVAGGLDLVLVRSKDGVRAYEAHCPHQGTLLSEGEIVGDELVCRAHGWRFDLATGERHQGSPKACLRAHPVDVADGKVLVQIKTNPEAEAGLGAANCAASEICPDLAAGRSSETRCRSTCRGYTKFSRAGREVSVRSTKPSIMGNTIVVVSDAEMGETLLRARPQSVRRVGTGRAGVRRDGRSGRFLGRGRLVASSAASRNGSLE